MYSFIVGNPSQKNKKAREIFEKVRNRQKIYKTVLEFPLSFPLFAARDAKYYLEKTESEILKLVEDQGDENFTIFCDYRPAIRPVGIELEDIFDWLMMPRIFDTTDNEVKKLEEIYSAYFFDLTRYSILFRIFAIQNFRSQKESRRRALHNGQDKERIKRKVTEFRKHVETVVNLKLSQIVAWYFVLSL